MESKKTFGEYICRRRKELDMTQREFAEQTVCDGVRRQQVGAGHELPRRDFAAGTSVPCWMCRSTSCSPPA